MHPVKIKWTGPRCTLDDNGDNPGTHLAPGDVGVLVGNNLAAWPGKGARLYLAYPEQYEVLAAGESLGGWDGSTVTPELIQAVLAHPNAISTLVEVMNADPELGPKIIKGVMDGLG